MRRAKLYRFRVMIPGGAVIATYYYTSGGVSLSNILASETWTPLALRNSEWDRTLDVERFDIEMPATNAPASAFVEGNPGGVVWVEVYDTAGQIQMQGRVVDVDLSEVKKRKAVLKVAAMGSVLDANVPTRSFPASCPFHLGDADCGVDLDGYEDAVPRSSCNVSDATISYTDATGEASGYYSWGFVRQGDQWQYITKQTKVGNTMTFYLLAPFASLDEGDDSFHFYPGCDKTVDTCEAKFDNLERFGGFPHVPYSNPVVHGIVDN